MKDIKAEERYKQVIKDKIQAVGKEVTMTLVEFDKVFTVEREVFTRGRTSKRGVLELETTGGEIEYESNLEKKIIKILDKAEDVISIKTQSLVLEYYYWGKTRPYYPDIVYLTKEGKVVVIEVKDTISMFKAKEQAKYKEFKRYCEEQGYSYAVLNGKDDIETIIQADINEELLGYLEGLLATRKSVTWTSIKDICKQQGYTLQEIMTVVYNKGWKIRSPRSKVWAFSITK